MKCGVNISKVTHAGRAYAAMTARQHGASIAAVKHLGLWNDGDAYRQAYDRAMPVDALLGAAMFNAQKPEQHCLGRDFLG